MVLFTFYTRRLSMTVLTEAQFEEFIEEYPEMEGCYTFCHLYKEEDGIPYDEED